MPFSDVPAVIAFPVHVLAMAKKIVVTAAMSAVVTSPVRHHNSNAPKKIYALATNIFAMVKTIVTMVATNWLTVHVHQIISNALTVDAYWIIGVAMV